MAILCRHADCPFRAASLEEGGRALPVCEVRGLMERRTVDSGERLLRQARPVGHVYFLREGYVKYTALLADGREQVLHFGTSGHVLGAELLDQRVAPYTVTALTRLAVCRFRTGTVERVLARNPGASLGIIRFLSAEIRRARASIRNLNMMCARERVAWFFLSLLPARERPVAVIAIPPRLKDVAEFLGLRAETLSRHLGRMKRAGILREMQDRVYRVDLARLEKLAGLSREEAV